MSWSAEQLRLLRAMGHEPMLLASSPAAMSDTAPARLLPAADARDAQASRPVAVPGVAGLAAALARAAGGQDISALALDLERLRREPALKRALWPRLRALRREH